MNPFTNPESPLYEKIQEALNKEKERILKEILKKQAEFG